MGCCCSSDDDDEERQSLVISDPRSVYASNDLATSPQPIESPIKTSTGGTPPPGPRLPPRRIRSTGPVPQTGSINDEQPVTVISSSPPSMPPDAPSRIMSPVALARDANATAPFSQPPPSAAAVAAAINANPSFKSPAKTTDAQGALSPSKDSKKEKEKKSKEKKEKKEKEKKEKKSKDGKKDKKGLFGRLFASGNKDESPDQVVIGGPTGFRRDQHISWDPEHGFDLQNLPPQWQTLFSKAGVTESELKNKDTALFIINVVAASLGSSSAWRAPNLMASQQLSASEPQAAPASPPPLLTPESPPDANPSVSSHSSYTSLTQLSLEAASASAVPQAGPSTQPLSAKIPPPVPPRSDVVDSTQLLAPSAGPLSPKAPPPPPAKSAASSSSQTNDVSATKPKPPALARTDTENLLAAIRAKGAAGLKKVEAAPDLKKLSSKEEDSLANILSRAMEARRAYLKEATEPEENDAWD